MARAGRSSQTVVIQRGSVWWVDLDPTRQAEIRKTHPAVVLGADDFNRGRRTVVIVPLSTGPDPRPPFLVAMPSVGEGSVVVCDQPRAVDKARLTQIAGKLSRDDLRAVEDGVRTIMQL